MRLSDLIYIGRAGWVGSLWVLEQNHISNSEMCAPRHRTKDLRMVVPVSLLANGGCKAAAEVNFRWHFLGVCLLSVSQER